MKKKNTFKHILSIVGDILLWAFVLFSMLITILVFSSQNNKDGIPSLMGKSLISIRTDSMKDAFSAGDLIIIQQISQEEVPNLAAEDVIIYRAPIDINGDGDIGDLNTHRIIKHDIDQNVFITKGDANAIADNEGDNPYVVAYTDVIGKYTGTCLTGVGNVINFLQTSLGFFLCVVLPLILFFLYELYNFISILVTERVKKTAAAEVSKDTEEEIKRKAIEEYLQQQKQKADAAPIPDDPLNLESILKEDFSSDESEK